MTTRDDAVQAIAALPGVGKVKAEALYEAGYTSVEKLQGATKEKLMEVPGIGPKIAEAILAGVRELAAPTPPPEKVEVVERAPTKKGKAAAARTPEEPVEIVEKKAHEARIKPAQTPELARAMWLKRLAADARPTFHRGTFWQKKQLADVWRTPRGIHNSQREGYVYRPTQPRVGFRTAVEARDLHPSGFREVLVHTADELGSVDAKTHAVRIGRTVGRRKRAVILASAKERGLRVLNPGRGTK